MKKLLLILLSFIAFTPAFAQESLLSSCNKNYPLSADNLYMLTLSTLNGAGQFEVIEMQTKSGYILFRAASKDYLVTISKNGPNSSGIKILPANSNFSNGTMVQKAIFDLLDQNLENIPKQVL